MTPDASGLDAEPPTTDRGAEQTADESGPAPTTTVVVRACGRFRRRFDDDRFEFTFEGETLREFVGALLGERPDLADLLIGETRRDDDAGWTDLRDDFGGDERPFVRIMINGTFNEYRGGAAAELSDGDRIELVEPLTC